MNDFGSGERQRLVAQYGRRFASGQVLFREGEMAAEVYLLHEGRVRLTKRARMVERNVVVLRPGELFGEAALIAESAHGTSAIAQTDGTALVWDNAAAHRLLHEDAAMGRHVLMQLARRVRDAEDHLAITMLRDPQSRIVSALLKLAEEADRVGDRADGLRVSPIELASRVGLDVDTVKRGVQKLRDGEYLIVRDEKILIADVEPLARLSEVLAVSDELTGATQGQPPLGRGNR